MPVDTEHKEYQNHTDIWERIRDVLAGEDDVKDAGAKYLPELDAQTTTDYAAYKMRALFHDASSRTLDGLAGAIFRKEPRVELPEGFAGLLENVTLRGTPFVPFAKMVARETLAMGRHGVLVDVPRNGGDPFQAAYKAENIVNWRQQLLGSVPATTLVVLREVAEEPKDDGFDTDEVTRYRVLRLMADEQGIPVYVQSLFEKVAEAGRRETFVEIDRVIPERRGEPLSFIPFMFFGPTDLRPDVQKAPILSLVNANLSHYRTSADIEHGAHFTALPTPWLKGDFDRSEASGPMRIGAGVAWDLGKDGEAGMLEFRGQGLNALEKRLERKEQYMAILGARLLEDRAVNESFDTVSLRHRGENSMLASIADTCGRGLGKTLGWQVWWAGGEMDSVKVELNKDFVDHPLTPDEVVKMVAAWQQGGIGGRTLHYNLQIGERLPSDMSFEDWQQDIEENGPAAGFLEFGETEDEAA